jgi:hypothetical protein
MNTTNFSFSSALLALALAGCASTSEPPLAQVPARLQPAGETMALVVPATGVQIYECRARKDAAGQYEWAFVAPDAELFDRKGRHIGRHYAGPHWEALDGSKVVASLRERADAPSGDAIPWLLLQAKSVGPAGDFSQVTSIQRVNTVGGTAPRNGCSQATVGQSARVAYTADYYFFRR